MHVNGEIKQLNLNEDREIYLNKEFDITIIEILPDKDNINNFLEIDLDITPKKQNINMKSYLINLKLNIIIMIFQI